MFAPHLNAAVIIQTVDFESRAFVIERSESVQSRRAPVRTSG